MLPWSPLRVSTWTDFENNIVNVCDHFEFYLANGQAVLADRYPKCNVGWRVLDTNFPFIEHTCEAWATQTCCQRSESKEHGLVITLKKWRLFGMVRNGKVEATSWGEWQWLNIGRGIFNDEYLPVLASWVDSRGEADEVSKKIEYPVKNMLDADNAFRKDILRTYKQESRGCIRWL